MIATKGYAVKSAETKLEPFSFERRELGDHDILIAIDYCGVCHSDIHQVRNEWGGSIYPMVPGHEIVGHATKVGSKVSGFKVGDFVGVGCLVDSCRTCDPCKGGNEQYCRNGFTGTYNAKERVGGGITYGGYSSQIVVNDQFALKVQPGQPLDKVAPLLCAGITTYSPLKHWNVTKGTKVAVVGLGGLGHMAVKLARSMGAEVTVLSTSKAKKNDALELGAHEFEATSDPATFKKLALRFDVMIDTVSAPHDYEQYLHLLAIDGAMVLLGVPPEAVEVSAFTLIGGRRSLGGSLIGGIKETQEMLDYCAKHEITSTIEVIPMKEINNAYERMMKSDVRYRFVIDMKTL